MHFYEDPNGSLGTKHNAALTMRSWLTFRNNPHQLQLVHHPTKEKKHKNQKVHFSTTNQRTKKNTYDIIVYKYKYIHMFLQHVFVALETKKSISQATPITTQRNELCTSGWSNFFSDSKDSASDQGNFVTPWISMKNGLFTYMNSWF